MTTDRRQQKIMKENVYIHEGHVHALREAAKDLNMLRSRGWPISRKCYVALGEFLKTVYAAGDLAEFGLDSLALGKTPPAAGRP